ncbi:MAG: hypothetical protein E6614_21530 [Bradyrhizobium sp.]|jgi:hypothetical protein|uniref:PEP-CTERM protein-sorting domain-containing protein n=2 Tax=Bradyrhizobium TaxID=374 RepID=A0ABS5GAY2_9BRAD|nr:MULTISPECIES: hypothetical protein [Bradyrhizobium]RTM05560.1 MAG: hypothetical protein EKK32_03115 [Bradyrhizobiaceae bacterium]MBR1138434.1 hypothetical protein [Bradyrhizobium denitrificans]MCL8485486.1 hypothetical protein [Bradyrhizobium denitrificans]MDU1491016.1 hypothetical protein [Bradyrhizobium sp.]MDU1541194.1 hypothetical protein [Bradyrhizobium sp.]
MRKSLALLALTAACIASVQAKAATVTLNALAFGTNTSPVISNQITENFDSRTAGTLANFTNGALSFTSQNSTIQNGSVAGQFAAPYFQGGADTSNYLNVFGGATETIKLSNSLGTYFGLYIGSLDTYNSISFYKNNSLIQSFSGTQIASLTGLTASNYPNSTASNANRYVEFKFDIGSYFDQIVLGSGTNSLEVDNLTVGLAVTQGVPEASTWMMMILGFLSVGLIGYRRRGSGVALRLV